MTDLSIDQVRAAQNNDLAATTAVIEATESRVRRLAEKAARKVSPSGGDRYMNAREEFEQTGRIAVWEALPRFEGDSVDVFYGFIYGTVENALMDAVREERNPGSGADTDAVKVFLSMLDTAGGDAYLAEKLAQTVPPKGRRLSADRANAARLAYQGAGSIDAPAVTVSDRSTRNSASDGEYSAVYSLAVNLASPFGVPDDLVTSDDRTREESRVKHAVVNGILDVMGDGQRTVIKHSFGIGGYTFYGHGDSGDDMGLATEIGTTVVKVRDARSKGLKAFAKRYVATVEKSDAQRALALSAAAAENLARGGRK